MGIDIGGTKTLVSVFAEDGNVVESIKFPTAQNYDDFLGNLADNVASLTTKQFIGGAIAAPGVLNRNKGVVIEFGNLEWTNVPVLADAEKITGCPLVLNNDAKLAALSEAALHPKYSRMLYVTISTGIGYALVVDGTIDDNVGDAGGRSLLVEDRGQMVPWESIASGSAIVRDYGKRASDLEDPTAWQTVARKLSLGLIELIAVTQPDVIITGGGAGQYLGKFHEPLVAELKKLEMPLLHIPPIIVAEHPEEAVVYGCYQVAKERYGK